MGNLATEDWATVKRVKKIDDWARNFWVRVGVSC